MTFAKYVVMFRISCLFAILSAAEENLKKWKNGSSFMIGCFTVRNDVLQPREALEKPRNFAKMC